jgi:hypothetical protein
LSLDDWWFDGIALSLDNWWFNGIALSLEDRRRRRYLVGPFPVIHSDGDAGSSCNWL